MSSADNPFKPPVDTSFYEAQLASPTLLWRQGNILVMHKDAKLPNRCVKSNVPTMQRLKRNLTWHTPWIYLTILISILVYIVIALLVSKKATIYVGLSDAWIARRRGAIAVGWGAVLASIGLPCLLIPASDGPDAAPLILIGAIFLLLFGIIYGMLRSRIVVPTRITDHYVWLKGVCPGFLQDLPQWPHAI